MERIGIDQLLLVACNVEYAGFLQSDHTHGAHSNWTSAAIGARQVGIRIGGVANIGNPAHAIASTVLWDLRRGQTFEKAIRRRARFRECRA